MDRLIYLLLFIWQLPQNIVALVMLPFLGSRKLLAYRHYCHGYMADNMRGGISLGNFVFVSKREDELGLSHEIDGHTVQSKMLGPLYLLVIGLPSICWLLFRRNNIRNYPDYYAFYTEKWANKCAGLISVKRNNYGSYYLKRVE